MRTQRAVMDYIRTIDPQTSLTPWALRNLVLTGQVPSVMVGRKRLIDLDTLEQYLLRAHEPEPSTDVTEGAIRPISVGK